MSGFFVDIKVPSSLRPEEAALKSPFLRLTSGRQSQASIIVLSWPPVCTRMALTGKGSWERERNQSVSDVWVQLIAAAGRYYHVLLSVLP